MIQRGRKGKEQLEVVKVSGLSVVERPSPPSDFTVEEAAVWTLVVDSMPADWFQPCTFPLLIQYCRHTVTAKLVSNLIEEAIDEADPDNSNLCRLLAAQAKETAALKAMAASMRIAQQSSYDFGVANTAKKKNVASGARPWDD